MTEDKYITIRILRTDYENIKARAARNHRSFPGEISSLLETIETHETVRLQIKPFTGKGNELPSVSELSEGA